ncbi:MAG: hypothetical protein AAGD25_02930 [Cyanobacteria bacterium P01_F01_bin.150]
MKWKRRDRYLGEGAIALGGEKGAIAHLHRNDYLPNVWGDRSNTIIKTDL